MSPILNQSPLPTRHAVRSLIEDLVGRDVDLRDLDRPIQGDAKSFYGVFITDQDMVASVAVLDFEGAARLGGALGMMPRSAVDEAIEDLMLPDLIRDNTYEVLNVMAAIFNVENAPHVRLYDSLYGPGGRVPPADVVGLSQVLGSRMDVALKVAGYGDAQLAIVTR
ncbi:MAG: hypothetical protein QG622_3257 [Actinomycetota bacterium]|nr:hypothetical protein [Actinomycetota bacterium]